MAKFRELRPFLFLLASIISTLVDIAVFMIFQPVAGVIIANIAGYCCGTLTAFIINRRLAFSARSAPDAFTKEAVRFFAVSGGGLALSTLIVSLATPVLGAFFSKLISLPATFGFNYLLSCSFVFRSRKTETPHDR